MSQTAAAVSAKATNSNTTAYKILFIIGLVHLLNDSIQAVIPAMFPILEKSMGLSFTQLGMIAFSLNIVSSILQPVIGMITDNGAVAIMERKMIFFFPNRSASGPPKNVPNAPATRKANRNNCASLIERPYLSIA